MKISLFIIIVLAVATLVGCTKNEDLTSPQIKKITSTQAKEMMDQSTDLIILDVRTEEEFNTGYIDKAIRITDSEINEKAETTLTDKSSTILVYCRSGRRSALAAKALNELGYTNVYDFGGINDWTYEVIK